MGSLHVAVMPGVSRDNLVPGVKKAELGCHQTGRGRQAGTRERGMDPSVEVWPLPSRRRQEGAGGQEEKRRIESLKDLMRDSGTAWEGPGSDKVWPGEPAVGVNSKENHNRGQQVPAVPHLASHQKLRPSSCVSSLEPLGPGHLCLEAPQTAPMVSQFWESLTFGVEVKL